MQLKCLSLKMVYAEADDGTGAGASAGAIMAEATSDSPMMQVKHIICVDKRREDIPKVLHKSGACSTWQMEEYRYICATLSTCLQDKAKHQSQLECTARVR